MIGRTYYFEYPDGIDIDAVLSTVHILVPSIKIQRIQGDLDEAIFNVYASPDTNKGE